jgi:uncharacterized membrane protein YkoI
MSIRTRIAIAAIAIFAVAPAVHAQADKIKETKPGLMKKAKLTPDSAIAAAQAKLPKAKFDAGELEEEGGKLIYSLDFKTDGKTGIDEVNIDAMTKADKDKAAKKAAKKP